MSAKLSTALLVLTIFVMHQAMTINAHAQSTDNGQDVDVVVFQDEDWSDTFQSLEKTKPVFVEKDSSIQLQPPPSNESLETTYELMYLRQIANEARTPENIKKIEIEQNGITDLIFGLGDENLPKSIKSEVDTIRAYASNDLNYFIYKEKRRFKRPRPHQLDSELTLTIPLPRAAAYPSGHAATSWMGGLIFSYIDPQNKALYAKYAGDVGFRRALAGIHYPSDNFAGRNLAQQVFDTLLQNPKFKTRMDAVKQKFQEYRLQNPYTVELPGIQSENLAYEPVSPSLKAIHQ